mmetsp:Transcript_15083/g.47377  ORF Transcript_15083/g.47377 Transcript_15083/m.47377 type:complete len:255 (+) Transcript_15083:19-783(+)
MGRRGGGATQGRGGAADGQRGGTGEGAGASLRRRPPVLHKPCLPWISPPRGPALALGASRPPQTQARTCCGVGPRLPACASLRQSQSIWTPGLYALATFSSKASELTRQISYPSASVTMATASVPIGGRAEGSSRRVRRTSSGGGLQGMGGRPRVRRTAGSSLNSRSGWSTAPPWPPSLMRKYAARMARPGTAMAFRPSHSSKRTAAPISRSTSGTPAGSCASALGGAAAPGAAAAGRSGRRSTGSSLIPRARS